MQVLRITRPGGPEVLDFEERPAPPPGPSELLVRVRATADGRLSELVRDGRSAYLHPRSECVRALARSKGLARALRRTIAPGPRMELAHTLLERFGGQ